jgi:ubiquinone/menaquinone biosynthesis methyltransferase
MDNNFYEPKFVQKLFDKMSGSYSRMNYISSFGFSERWRKAFVKELSIKNGTIVVDLMAGMGECWKFILHNDSLDCQIVGLDFSSQMIKRATKTRQKFKPWAIELLEENVFSNSIPDNSADYVISGFGLKTFNEHQLKKLSLEIKRILKPGGRFSVVDVSVPGNPILRAFYMFYLKKVIPIIGFLFLGDPENYKMLGIYTQEFVNSKKATEIFGKQGFNVEYFEYFFGCASGIKGIKN